MGNPFPPGLPVLRSPASTKAETAERLQLVRPWNLAEKYVVTVVETQSFVSQDRCRVDPTGADNRPCGRNKSC